MDEKETMNMILRQAITKAAIYYYCDGFYLNNKRVELDELLSKEEMNLIKPYIENIKEVALGYPSYNDIVPKTNSR